MANRRRVSALILCVGLVLILAVSTVFIAHEADHDCCGEDCPICRMIALTTALMRILCLIAATGLLWSVLSAASSAFRHPVSVCLRREDTPVSRKTRIND